MGRYILSEHIYYASVNHDKILNKVESYKQVRSFSIKQYGMDFLN